MALEVKHATQAVGTDSGTGEIHKSEWNEAHDLVGTLPQENGGTGKDTPTAAANALDGFLEIVSSASPVSLTVTSPRTIFVTGSSNQAIVLAAANTIEEGWTHTIINQSTGVLTVQSPETGFFTPQDAGITATYTCTSVASGSEAWSQRFAAQAPSEISMDGGNF